MSHTQNRHVMALLDRVLELSAEAREDVLARCASTEPEVVERVRALLRADEQAPAFLDAGVAPRDEPARSTLLPDGSRIGPYTILGHLGRGGMGAVYLAQRDDVRMRVAIKVVTTELANPERIARFVDERRVLARLEHPNIARFLDAGVADDGTPWFAMEYVEGRPIDRHCDEERLTVSERLALFERVGLAVAYAHRNLVVHRDLKPSNVMVTSSGEPKLVDFGIAKLLAAESGDRAALTGDGGRPMTPEYASPEQFRGEPITTASDVYQLGILLHELLAGRRPRRADGHPLNFLGSEREREPVRPSSVLRLSGAAPNGMPDEVSLAEVGALRRTTPERLRRMLAGDLDNIVMAALHPLPERRYQSAQQFVDDVRRHRTGHPILATPGPLWSRVAKAMRRHRLAASLSTALVLLLAGSLGVISAQSRRATRERDRAAQLSSVLRSLLVTADPTARTADSSRVRAMLDAVGRQARDGMRKDPEVWAPILVTLGDVYRNRGNADAAMEVLRDAVRGLATRGAPGDSVMLTARSSLGLLLVERGDIGEGLRLLEETVRSSRHLPEARRAELAPMLVDLGFGRQVAGDDAQARQLYEEAFTLFHTLPDSGGLQYFPAVVNLGFLYQRAGDNREAEVLFRRAVEGRRRLLGPDHSQTLGAATALAGVLLNLGRYAEADGFSRDILLARQVSLDAPHVSLASSLELRSRVLAALGRSEEAEALARDALAMFRQLYGETHLNVAFTLNALSLIVRDRGRVAEAVEIARDAVANYTRAVGEHHVATLLARASLADLERRAGRVDIAESLFQTSLAALDSLGPDRPTLLVPLTNFATLLAQRGRCAEAMPLLDRAMELARAAWPPGHVNSLRARHQLGGCLLALGRISEAQPVLIAAKDDALRAEGPARALAADLSRTLASLDARRTWPAPTRLRPH